VVDVFAPVRDYIDALVHPSARHDALMAARHRAFIGSRIALGFTALASFPVYLVFNGVPGTLEALVFCWMLLPIANAYFLARTGWFEASQALAALALSLLVAVVAAKTGGIASFAAIWFVAVPLEAALAGSRRAVIAAACFALAATFTLVHLQTGGMLPASQIGEADRTLFSAAGIVSCALYATAVAVRAGSLMQIGSRLLSVGDARYHLLARNMTDVITRHGRNGAVRFASPAAESLFAVPPRDLIGHGLFDRVHVADRPAYLTALSEAATCGDARSVEFRVRRDPADQEGQQRPHFIWVEMRCRPLGQSGQQAAASNALEAWERRDADGCEVVAVMRDVTDRKAQEQAVEDARREAERANAAKSRFLATVTHELRTPLNAVIGFSDMLTHEEAMKLDAARRRDYAQLINESGQHLLSVVNDILDVSKIETGNFAITPEPFAPAPTLKTCCDILALKARDAGVDLILRAPDHLPEIVADKRAFKQILLNLLSNAVKFTDRGGRVTVSARSDASGFGLTVEDTGVGIDAADLGRVGDPFFQARGSYTRPYDGTGLGLSIVKGLVSLHGGSIDIQSRVGEGTCITVRLPLDCETSRRDETSKRRPVAELPVIRSQPEHQVRKSA
jgi:two-component system, cell cycle sensor histidine kinase DivJ